VNNSTTNIQNLSIEKCEVENCENEASRMTATDSKYIQVCSDCYWEKYKK